MPDSNKLKFSGKKALVVGLGVSGLWTARWLALQGALVTVSDTKSENELDPGMCREIRELGVTLESGGHEQETFLNADMIIVSPGVPQDMELLGAAMKKHIPVMGELELAGRLVDKPMIAVTGTNGKSTVTAFLGFMLKNSGFDVFVGGNIGTPLTAFAAGERKADYVVVEVSSFQLDTIENFCPFVSMILNISPDHLDRYSNYDSYVKSKLRICRNQGPGQYVILNDDDKALSPFNPSSGVSVLRYGIERKRGRHAFVENKSIMISLNGMKNHCFSFESFDLPGRHNLENLLAIVLCGLILGIESTIIQKSIDEFKGLQHRLERVAELDGVTFYNDSKATNVDAAVSAVMSFDRPLILIAGGRHKGADYLALVRTAQGRVKRAVFFGEARDLLATAFEGIVPFLIADSMEKAVAMSFACAESGDVVLLAPACSSFDMFSDYSHRGRVFRSAVERLVHG